MKSHQKVKYIKMEKNELEIYKKCEECDKEIKLNLPKYEEKNIIKLEHSFKYNIYEKEIDINGQLKIGDIAHLDEKNNMDM